jgi:hypothetical protein
MYHRWAALALVLALWYSTPKSASGQSDSQPEQQPPRGRKSGILGQNFPNPFNPETRIPFGIECADGAGGEHVVSVHIYNVLAQLVAVPVLEGPGQAAENLRLPCGSFVAFWDGKMRGTGREAASGIYIYELVVDGERTSKKMIHAK